MRVFSHMIARTRSMLVHQKSKGMKSIKWDLRDTELGIKSMKSINHPSSLSQLDQLHLKFIYNKCNALLHQNFLKWAQRIRLMCVQKGDSNSSFFHNVAEIYKHQNFVSHIGNLGGSYYTDRVNIENSFIYFYTKLQARPDQLFFSHIFHALPNDLNTISEANKIQLVREVSKKKFTIL